MDNSSGVAEVDAIDKLEHKKLDLIACDVCGVKLEIFFEVVISEFKNEMELFLAGTVNDVHETEIKSGVT